MKLTLADNRILRFLDTLLFPNNLKKQIDSEEYRRRIFAQISMIASIPVFIIYGIWDVLYENKWESIPDWIICSTLVICIFVLRKVKSGTGVYALVSSALAVLLFFNLIHGMGEGGDLLWFYVYPLASFSVWGKKKGLFWNLLTLPPSIVIVSFPNLLNSFPYPTEFSTRFAISLTMVTGFAFALESLRFSFYQQLEKQKCSLQEALDNVKTLSGLLPICSSCKKIRDDDGYWRNLEGYLSKHTDAMFSHGICITCLKQTSPEIYQEMLKAGEIRESQDADPPFSVSKKD